jgi:type I restriction-modification system DNA methylase subunit
MGIKTALDITIKNSARFKGGNLLSEADLETIANVIVNGTEIEGVSRFVSPGEIEINEFDLTPARYVTEVIETEDISLKEIDDELNLLYEKLLRTHTR